MDRALLEIKPAIPYHAAMNTNLIRERLNRDARPFFLRLTMGPRVIVAHPDFAAVSPGQIAVMIQRRNLSCDPLHVVAIEEVTRKRPNGK